MGYVLVPTAQRQGAEYGCEGEGLVGVPTGESGLFSQPAFTEFLGVPCAALGARSNLRNRRDKNGML